MNRPFVAGEHSTLHTAFRVVVYRIKLEDIYDGKPLDDTLYLDPASATYGRVSRDLSEHPDSFLKFLNAINDNITRKYNDVTRVSKEYLFNGEKDFYQEIDITPLVAKVSTSLSLEGMNTCNIVMFDQSMMSIDEAFLQRFYSMCPWYSSIVPYKKDMVESLNTFKLREFDVVRVFSYSSKEESLDDRISSIRTFFSGNDYYPGLGTVSVGSVKLSDKASNAVSDVRADSLVMSKVSRFVMPVAFTGTVSSITRTTSADNSSSISAQCLGIYRYLTQTSVVMNQAIANQIALGVPDLGTTANSPLNVTENVFSGMNILDIINYLLSGTLRQVPGKNNVKNYIGLPDSSKIIKDIKSLDDKGKPQIIQFLVNLIVLHILKEKYMEPILYYDDNFIVENPVTTETNVEINTTDTIVSTQVAYLNLIRDSYDNFFDTTYMSPSQIIDESRASSFMEIFEDRAGTIRIRSPKYNNVSLDTVVSPYECVSAQVVSSDSNNFSVVQSKMSLPIYGVLKERWADVYADKLSVFRYGFRVAAPIENPNAISEILSQELAKFMRYYGVAREARSAVINKIGDPTISPGDMIGFQVGIVNNTGETYNKYYVGYVMELQEDISIDGSYAQMLNLKFVRECSEFSKSQNKIFKVPIYLMDDILKSNKTSMFDLLKTGGVEKDFIVPFSKNNGSSSFEYISHVNELVNTATVEGPEIHEQIRVVKSYLPKKGADEIQEYIKNISEDIQQDYWAIVNNAAMVRMFSIAIEKLGTYQTVMNYFDTNSGSILDQINLFFNEWANNIFRELKPEEFRAEVMTATKSVHSDFDIKGKDNNNKLSTVDQVKYAITYNLEKPEDPGHKSELVKIIEKSRINVSRNSNSFLFVSNPVYTKATDFASWVAKIKGYLTSEMNFYSNLNKDNIPRNGKYTIQQKNESLANAKVSLIKAKDEAAAMTAKQKKSAAKK